MFGSVLRLLRHCVCLVTFQADVVKVVTTAASHQDALQLIRVAEDVKSEFPAKTGVIALSMGNRGKISRVLNKVRRSMRV